MCFSKVGSLEFIAMVMNCTTKVDIKSPKMDAVVETAGKYLDVQGFTAEYLKDVLNERVLSSGLLAWCRIS